jgi:hypothetical protein
MGDVVNIGWDINYRDIPNSLITIGEKVRNEEYGNISMAIVLFTDSDGGVHQVVLGEATDDKLVATVAKVNHAVLSASVGR